MDFPTAAFTAVPSPLHRPSRQLPRYASSCRSARPHPISMNTRNSRRPNHRPINSNNSQNTNDDTFHLFEVSPDDSTESTDNQFREEGAQDFVDAQIVDENPQQHPDDPRTGVSNVDDAVDDGFFSRYQRQLAETGPTADNDTPRANAEPDPNRAPRKVPRGSQEEASNAFDAVDKLLASGPSSTPARRRDTSPGTSRRDRADGNDREADRSPNRNTKIDPADVDALRSPGLNRDTWLADVTARASTTPARTGPNPTPLSDTPVDVDVVDAQNTSTRRASTNNYARNDQATASSRATRNNAPSKAEDLASNQRSPLSSQFADDDHVPKGETTGFRQSTFETLMQVARKGPGYDASKLRRGPHTEKPQTRRQPQRSTSHTSRGSSSMTGSSSQPPGSSLSQMDTNQADASRRAAPSRTPSDSAPRESSGRTVGSGRMREAGKPVVSQLLGLTKQFLSEPGERARKNDKLYEPMDDEMERSIDLKGRLAGKAPSRRARFTRVRRVGNQTRRVMNRPDDWRPLTVEEVNSIVPDYRPLGLQPGYKGGDGRNGTTTSGVVNGCPDCDAAGLETCRICLGEGWVPPLNSKEVANETDEERKALLIETWNRPNLVVNTSDEAQCLRCNGIGKEFCGTCKGSGSSMKKGFNLSDKYKVFDMFAGSPDGPSLDDIDFDEIGDDDDTDEDEEDENDNEEEELESFKLYQGSVENYKFQRKRPDIDEGTDDEDVEDESEDVLEIEEDDSEELFATLEAMHVADVEKRNAALTDRAAIRRIAMDHDDDEDDDDDDDDDDVDDDEVDDVFGISLGEQDADSDTLGNYADEDNEVDDEDESDSDELVVSRRAAMNGQVVDPDGLDDELGDVDDLDDQDVLDDGVDDDLDDVDQLDDSVELHDDVLDGNSLDGRV